MSALPTAAPMRHPAMLYVLENENISMPHVASALRLKEARRFVLVVRDLAVGVVVDDRDSWRLANAAASSKKSMPAVADVGLFG